MHYKNHVLRNRNRVARDENRVASMGRVLREGGNLLLRSTIDLPFESKDNLYYTTDVYYTMM